MKAASILHYRRSTWLIETWILTLPVDVPYRTYKKLMARAAKFEYILWREGLGFRFYEKTLSLSDAVQNRKESEWSRFRILHNKKGMDVVMVYTTVGKVGQDTRRLG